MNTEIQFPNNGYFIASGFTNTMYTLRKRFIKHTDNDSYEASVYVCKLAADKDKALAKAKELTGFELGVEFELNDWGTGGTTTYKGDGSNTLVFSGEGSEEQIIIKKPEEVVKTTVMSFGKYQGKTIAEIAEFDKAYLVWAYYNSYGKKFECVADAIAIAIQDVIEERAVEAKKAADEQEARIAKALEAETTPNLIANVGEKVKGVFKYVGYTEYNNSQNAYYTFVNEEGETFILNGSVGQNFYGRIYNVDNLGIKRLKYNTNYEIAGIVSEISVINGEWVEMGDESRHTRVQVAQVRPTILKAVK